MTRNSIAVMALMLAAGLASAAPSDRQAAGRITSAGLDLAPNETLLLPDSPETFPVEETLRYYSGEPASKLGASGGMFIAGTRFTPAFPCTAKAVFFFQVDAALNSHVIIYGLGTDTTPGPVIDSAPYSGAGSETFKRVNLASPLFFKTGSEFWACVRFKHSPELHPASGDGGPMVPHRGGFVYEGSGWAQLSDFGIDRNWMLGVIVGRGVDPEHDVGAVRINVPGSHIDPGVLQPEVQLANFGLNAEANIPVTCTIDSAGTEVYRDDTVFAGPLAQGSRVTLTFSAPWHTGPADNVYNVNAFSSLATDLDPSNDTASQTTVIEGNKVVATLDTGYCALSVTSFGAIGYDAPEDAGVGFQYPKGAPSGLRYAALAVGNDPTSLADRFYGCPSDSQPDPDFETYDSLHAVFPPNGDQQYKGSYTDNGLARPRDLHVAQNCHQSTGTDNDDFVVMAFDIRNYGISPQNGMYAGVFADFDIGATPEENVVATDLTRRLVYSKPGTGNENPSLGVKILAPESYANLSAIDHALYVFPDSAMTDGMKLRFLDGTIVQRASDRPYDWSVVASVGPFNLDVGANQRFAVAFVGGTSATNLQDNADKAQAWYATHTGLEQTPDRTQAASRLALAPNPLRNRATVSYYAAREGLLQLRVYDAGGRMVDTKTVTVKAGNGSFVWEPGNLARGVYFLDVRAPENHSRTKALLLE